MSLGPSCPVCPFSTESGGTEINTRVQGTLAPGDVARREARHVYSEGLWSQRQRGWVEGNPELVCPWVINPGTSASVDWNMLHPFQVSLKGKGKESLPARPWLALGFLISPRLCFMGGGYACVIDGVDSWPDYSCMRSHAN
jgi:hypothetical protein